MYMYIYITFKIHFNCDKHCNSLISGHGWKFVTEDHFMTVNKQLMKAQVSTNIFHVGPKQSGETMQIYIVLPLC